MSILSLNNISKVYGSYRAVDHVSIDLPEQSIFGLLGPNGAGKTTLIRMITNILFPDEGEILFDGKSLSEYHSNIIGYMPEERGLYKKMKVGEHLIYLARLKGLSKSDAKKRIEYWFEKFEITAWWNKKVHELSKGMQQKIQFVSTILHEPKLIILDEPFSGLDPINSNLIKNEIYELRQKGATILFSTHRMEQVEEICDDIVLINKGKIILDGKVKAIKQQFKQNKFSVRFVGNPLVQSSSIFTIIESEKDEIIVHLENGANSNDLLNYLLAKNYSISSFNEMLPSLNEIFITQVTGGAK